VANKYSFKSLETWALDAIQEYVNRKPSPILSAIPSPNIYAFPGTEHQPSIWPSNYNSQKETANIIGDMTPILFSFSVITLSIYCLCFFCRRPPCSACIVLQAVTSMFDVPSHSDFGGIFIW
jgi:hypothetical protein